ncbi:MAG TPA: sodium:solute symporter family protein [Anaerolineae bacterium]|nr:sodium:solute symporter family protein [Anaerolineae bacterium]
MQPVDGIIVIVWLCIVLTAGVLAGRRAGLERFWVNERATPTSLLVFTIVATQVGGGTVIGIASSSFASGTGFGLVAIVSTVTGFLLVAWLAPWAKRFGDRNSAYTLPEVIGKRYGRRAQLAASGIILFAYLSLLAGQLVSAGVLVSIWTGSSLVLALILAAGGVIVYTAYAGLRGDIVVDAILFWAMGIILFGILLPFVGTGENLMSTLRSLPSSAWSPLVFGGYTYLVAGILLGGIIPVVSMEMWMRVYAATTQSKARTAFIWSALAVIPFYALPLFLGLAATRIIPSGGNPDRVLFELMTSYVPPVFLGICVAGVLSVVISSANTMIVVVSAVIYRDILGRKAGVEALELRWSRIITFSVGLAGCLFALAVPDIVQLVINAFFVVGMLTPALVGVVLWRRATGAGAFVSLVLGGITTVAFLPLMPKQAFVPGIILSIIAFAVVSKLTRHAATEDLNM